MLHTSAQWLKRMHRMPFMRNLAKLQSGSIVMSVIGLASSIVYARMLGLELFGTYAVAAAYAGLLSFFSSFGQESATAIFFSEHLGKKDHAGMTKVVQYFLQATVASTLVILLLIVLANPLAGVVQGRPDIGPYAQIILLTTALQWAPTICLIAMQMVNRFGELVVWEVTRAALQLVISTTLLWFGFGVWGVLLGPLIISIVYVPACLWRYGQLAAQFNLPKLSLALLTGSHRHIGKYFVQGVWIALDRSVSGNIYPNAFYLLLGRVTSVEVVGLFRLGLRLASLPATFVLPNVARLANIQVPKMAGEGMAALHSGFRKLIFGSLGLGLAATAGALIFVPPLLPYVYGREFTGAIVPFLLLLPINFTTALHAATVPLMRVINKTWFIVIMNIVGVCIAAAGFYGLLPLLGPMASAAAAVLIYHANTMFLFIVINRHFRPKTA